MANSNNKKFVLPAELVRENSQSTLKEIEQFLHSIDSSNVEIDFGSLENIDSAGVAVIDQVYELSEESKIKINLINVSKKIDISLSTFSSRNLKPIKEKPKPKLFEFLGESGFRFWEHVKSFVYLCADIFYWGIGGLFNKKGQRKGEFTNQSNLIGVNAIPIIALISFLIGFILTLQSAQQLRQFGADIFVVDLIAISMTREMAPLMTAIILAGRSGSSIASELATMKISEEIDALKTMALNPIKYVVLPKLYAMTIATPLLTILADAVGILGGFVVGVLFLKIGAAAFLNRMASVMVLKDIITMIVKSFVFSWIITVVGIYFGLEAKGGADSVGKNTTASVVTAIFMVIVADSILGLLFY